MTPVHTDPSVLDLFNVVRISLNLVVLQLLSYVVAQLHFFVVFTLQTLERILSELTETHLD